jgi:hypothetical protein
LKPQQQMLEQRPLTIGTCRLRDAALQDIANPPPMHIGSCSNLTFGVSMPGDPSLKATKSSGDAVADSLDLGRAPSQLRTLSLSDLGMSSASFHSIESMWSDLKPREKPPPPFGLGTAELILRGELTPAPPAEAGPSPEGAPPGRASPQHPEAAWSAVSPGGSLMNRLETEHLRAPSGLLYQGPNPFAESEGLQAANPFCGTGHFDFNPFAAAADGITTLKPAAASSTAKPAAAVPVPPPVHPESVASSSVDMDTVGSLPEAISAAGLSSVNTFDRPCAVSLHPSMNGYESHGGSLAPDERDPELAGERLGDGGKGGGESSGAGTGADLQSPRVAGLRFLGSSMLVPASAFSEPIIEASDESVDSGNGPLDVEGLGLARDRPGGDGEGEGSRAGPRGAGVRSRGVFLPVERLPLTRASAPVEGSKRQASQSLNPFKDFACVSFDRVTTDTADFDGIPSPTSSNISFRGL